MSVKGIYISREQLQALSDWARRTRYEAEARLAEIKAQKRAETDAYYIHKTTREPLQPGKVLDIREHLKKRYL